MKRPRARPSACRVVFFSCQSHPAAKPGRAQHPVFFFLAGDGGRAALDLSGIGTDPLVPLWKRMEHTLDVGQPPFAAPGRYLGRPAVRLVVHVFVHRRAALRLVGMKRRGKRTESR